MKPKSKSELKEQLEICDKIIILQREIIKFYQMRIENFTADGNQLSNSYKKLLKFSDENYKGLEITDDAESN